MREWLGESFDASVDLGSRKKGKSGAVERRRTQRSFQRRRRLQQQQQKMLQQQQQALRRQQQPHQFHRSLFDDDDDDIGEEEDENDTEEEARDDVDDDKDGSIGSIADSILNAMKSIDGLDLDDKDGNAGNIANSLLDGRRGIDGRVEIGEAGDVPANDNRLGWSLDPHKSDWTIEIISKEDSTSTLYKVHKVILAVGPWKCSYFEKLLEETEQKEPPGIIPKGEDNKKINKKKNETDENNSSKWIRIKLHKLAADAFPAMLDYCYGAPTAKLDISTETASGLHSLGKCFGNKWLTWEAKQFWQNDLCADNCHVYYVHASVLCDEEILASIKEMLVVNMKTLSAEENSIISIAPPEFWLEIFEMRFSSEEFKDDIIPPSLVADILICHKDKFRKRDLRAQDRGRNRDDVTGGSGGSGSSGEDSDHDDMDEDKYLEYQRIFHRLTSEEFLPFVDPDAGRRLLKVHPITDSLTSLHVRCLTSVPGHFIADVCEHVCPGMTSDIFEIVTSDEFLNEIDCDLACRLLQIEPKFVVKALATEDKLTPLQQKCLTAFCQKWPTLDNHDEVIDFLQTQNPVFLREICKGTASQLTELHQRLEATQSVLNKALIREREMRRDYEDEIDHLNDMLCNSVAARRDTHPNRRHG